MNETDKIVFLSNDGFSQDLNGFAQALENYTIIIRKTLAEIRLDHFELFLDKFRSDIDSFAARVSIDNAGDLTSYVPRFGTFNQFLHIPCVIRFGNSKPFKGYFKPILFRKQFMQLKRFVNLRFERCLEK